MGLRWRWEPNRDGDEPRIVIHENLAATDEQLINRELDASHRERRPISDAGARVIAAVYHGGEDSALMELATTGSLAANLHWEMAYELTFAEAIHDAEARQHMNALADYVASRRDTGPVRNWAAKWLRRAGEGEARCPVCGGEFGAGHSLRCPFVVDAQ